eukprot:jgi/Botrbrau1/6657/Bobra.0202s0005.1
MCITWDGPVMPYSTVVGRGCLDWTCRPGRYMEAECTVKVKLRAFAPLLEPPAARSGVRISDIFSTAVFILPFQATSLFRHCLSLITRQNAVTLGLLKTESIEASGVELADQAVHAMSGTQGPESARVDLNKEQTGPESPNDVVTSTSITSMTAPSGGTSSTMSTDARASSKDSPPGTDLRAIVADGTTTPAATFELRPAPVEACPQGTLGDPGRPGTAHKDPSGDLGGNESGHKGEDGAEEGMEDRGVHVIKGNKDNDLSSEGSSGVELPPAVPLEDLEVVLQQLQLYRLSEAQIADCTLDLLTGFQVVDGNVRLLVVEGLEEGAMKEVQRLAMYISAAAGALNPAAASLAKQGPPWGPRAFYSASVRHPGRRLAPLGPALWTMRLCKPLSALVADPVSCSTSKVPLECREALRRLSALAVLGTHGDHHPLDKARRSGGLPGGPHQTSNGAPQSTSTGQSAGSEAIAQGSADMGSPGEPAASLARVPALRTLGNKLLNWSKDIKELGLLPSVNQLLTFNRKFGVELTDVDLKGQPSIPMGAACTCEGSAAKAAGGQSMETGGAPDRRRGGLVASHNQRYCTAHRTAAKVRATRNWKRRNAARLRIFQAKGANLRAAWAAWNPQREAARELYRQVMEGEMTLEDAMAARAPKRLDPVPGDLPKEAAKSRGWYPHPRRFKWPAPPRTRGLQAASEETRRRNV